MKLISLKDLNEMVLAQKKWAPFRNGMNGLSCPTCGGELRDKPGSEIEKREDASTFRVVQCPNKLRSGDDCGFLGVRELS